MMSNHLLSVQVATFQPSDIAFNVAFSKDSKFLLMDIKDRSVVVCEVCVTRTPEQSRRGSQADATAGSEKLEAPTNSNVKLVFRHLLKPPSVAIDPEGFRIKAVFGGKHSAFVAMGSVRGEVRLWHWSSEKFLCALEGHTETCNAVAWHPTDPHMLVSASDDSSMRVWTSPITAGRDS
jgi:WD domain, G-beta repeat